ncbi:MAG: 50S ribosomal protein L35 [Alphaproteobacteria bacterium MarineAlpha5_Bin11]|nr:50S ribosomal protein L35 [Pelagibacteraceae bacterium]PPR44741.1 MAG: 50S ribosomal protein L35 [Alphaproteobacteria bacterium MarineAlpha5_Bin11]PPR52179.1 MAG: 50S ribosomal protein L35 [Alphaproteobacteria bacterium MarineAlpha5_Bin10]|tara:strand:- start:125 stop:325 length:201 start_codon:yes stop_codon:yes gene_type:complete
MPKLKTKNSLRKRFKRNGSGKLKMAASGKRHGMSKRSKKFIRSTRGMEIMSSSDASRINHLMPYNK